MAWETGTATNHEDLLSKLETFLSTDTTLVAAGENWNILSSGAQWPGKEGSYTRYLAVKGPGSSAGDEVFGFMACRDDTSPDISPNIWFWGTKNFTTIADWDQEVSKRGVVALTTTDQGMTYWFFANGRRFVIVVKIGSGYYSAHMGWGLPYSTPTEYPYPYYCCANITDYRYRDDSYSWSDIRNSSIVSPVAYGTNEGDSSYPFAIDPQGNWRRVFCRYYSSGNDIPNVTQNASAMTMWPSNAIGSYITSSTENYQKGVASNIDGTPSLTPVYFFNSRSASDNYWTSEAERGVYFQLDEIYLMGSDDPIVPESEVTVNGKTYIAFPNGTNQSRGETWCILKE